MRLIILFTIGAMVMIVGINGNPGSVLAALIDPTALTENKS